MFLNEGEKAAWALLPNREVSMLMTNERVSEKSGIIRTLSYFIDTDKRKEEKMGKRVKQ